MRRTLACLLALPLLCPLLAAYAQDYGDFTYVTNGSAITITGYSGSGGAVVVPDAIHGLPVNCLGDGAFAQARLTGITIPGSVMRIGDWVFASCLDLTNIVIPDRVISLGNHTFDSCTALTGATIGAGVTNLGHDAFAYCIGLARVMVGGSVNSIGEIGRAHV